MYERLKELGLEPRLLNLDEGRPLSEGHRYMVHADKLENLFFFGKIKVVEKTNWENHYVVALDGQFLNERGEFGSIDDAHDFKSPVDAELVAKALGARNIHYIDVCSYLERFK